MAKHDPSGDERLLAQSFRTGHKPKEPIEVFLARVRANSFLDNQDVPVPPGPPRPSQKPRKTKIVRMVEKYTYEQLALAMDILEGRRARLNCGDDTYAVKKLEDGAFSIVGLDTDTHEYFVKDGQCTCEDCKFRKRECKHLRAIRSIA